MNVLNKLERRFGSLAIPHLFRWIVLLNAIGYVMLHVDQGMYDFLALDSARVMQGEVWRLFTYLFIPPNLSPIWIIFALYFTYLMGEGLENEWGAFRLNVFYFIGMFSTTVIAFFFSPGAVDNTYLNTSVFLAFATIYPDFMIYLFFIIPVKIKWLGILSGVFLFWRFMMGDMPERLAILVSLLNYFLFFGRAIYDQVQLRRQADRARARFKANSISSTDEHFHCCKVCKRTEATSSDLIFRIAQDGEEYCTEHLPPKKEVHQEKS